MNEHRRILETPVEAGAVLQTKPTKSTPEEGSVWFWRIFGGTILGAITFLLVTLLNHLNANIDAIRTQQTSWQKETQKEISDLRDKVVKTEESTNIIKETNKESNLKERITALEQAKELDKERKEMVDEKIKSIQNEVKELQKKP